MEHRTIGQLAQAAQVHVETVRYYERRGLITRPAKPRSGFRRYPPETLRDLRFVHAAKRLGFTLSEIQTLLGLLRAQHMTCGELVSQAQQKRREVQQRISELQAIEEALDQVIERCSCEPAERPCPVLESLPDLQAGRGCGCGPNAPPRGQEKR